MDNKDIMATPKFNSSQIEQIRLGLCGGLEISTE